MGVRFKIISLWLCVLLSNSVFGQACVGGQIYTQEAFLYGRFEVGMRSAAGNGIVSSFFLYNLDLGCNWPAENNEIDIEMTGDRTRLLFTTHYPGPWYYTDSLQPAFDPHAAVHDYAIEWEPGVVRWFVDDSVVNVQNQPFVYGLLYPQRIIMNLWASAIPSWTGVWDPSIMPASSEYDYVRCYTYTPGAGTHGTSNNFTLSWEDQFDDLDTSRWIIEEFGGFSNNYCTFMESSVEYNSGKLFLQLEPETPATATPVTFSVDMSQEEFDATDVIYLNGSFNGWCGTCNPMTRTGEIWTTTVYLPPGKHEYLFTLNFWEENGGAPLGSDCDFQPCDEYANYGLVISPGDPARTVPAKCWKSCGPCSAVGPIVNQQSNPKGGLPYQTFDLLGRPVSPESGKLLIYHYSDGRVEKRLSLPNQPNH